MGGGRAHLSSSSCLSTSPMICPTLCNALMLSSVWSNSFCRSLISRRRFLSFVSQSLDSISFCLNEKRACSRSRSDAMVPRRWAVVEGGSEGGGGAGCGVRNARVPFGGSGWVGVRGRGGG